MIILTTNVELGLVTSYPLHTLPHTFLYICRGIIQTLCLHFVHNDKTLEKYIKHIVMHKTAITKETQLYYIRMTIFYLLCRKILGRIIDYN